MSGHLIGPIGVLPAAGGGGTVYTFDKFAHITYSASSTINLAYAVGTAANVLVVAVICTADGPSASCVDGAGSFNFIGSDAQAGHAHQTADLWWAFRASPSGNVTINTSTLGIASGDMWIFTFTGTTTPAIDTGGTFTGNTSPAWTSGAGIGNELLVGAVGPNNGQLTIGSPWAGDSPSGEFGAFVYRIVTGGGVTGATINDSGGTAGGYFNGMTTAFK